MLQLALFALLFFLPVNVTPPLVIWIYEKLLSFSEPVVSVIEAVQIVLVVMFISQALVNQIEERPVLIKVYVSNKSFE